jgi:hypothetical protein
MLETVRGVMEVIDLDLLIIGFREAPEIFRQFCGPARPVEETYLWFSALSDIEGMTESDLVVNWRGERSRGWGGWAEAGSEVAETFRFVCPNNPKAREKTKGNLRELLVRYDFKGVFLDKIRFPSPANGIDELLSCFCEHCRGAAKAEGLDLDAVIKIFGDRTFAAEAPVVEDRDWLESLSTGTPLLSHFVGFRAASIARLVTELADEARRVRRKVSLDLFSPCLAPAVGQDYRRLKTCCDWVKPMTYRVAEGPAGLRLELPALIEGASGRFALDEAAVLQWSALRAGFDATMLRQTREKAVPLPFIQAEIEAAVRALAPIPVYFGLELVSQPGVIDVTPADVVAMVEAGRAANAAGLIISWDLMHAPIEGVRALAESARA